MVETDIKSSPKKLLCEVSFIRPIVIFLLIFLHSFTKIAKGGGQTNDYQLSIVYQWLCWLISGFRIETIALVAGYIFAYQSINLKRSYKFWPFVLKKFKRLIIPMLVFGLIYYFCFLFNASVFSVKSFLLDVFSGCGHLWFLPMLFWCFLVIWIIDHYKLSSWKTLIILAIVSTAPLPATLPFGLARLPHFVFYVYAGYFLWTKREWLHANCLKTPIIICLWLAYILLVVVLHSLMSVPSTSASVLQKGLIIMTPQFIGLLMSCCGIIALYLTICKTTTKEGFQPKSWVIVASDYCYGVYVYHQFILILLYFKTPLVANCPPLLVPWIGFAITALVSLLLTKLTLKTKTGKYLIG